MAHIEKENLVKGKMYSETALFRIIKMLDQLIIISEEAGEGY